jgi:hypothetical protein
MMRLNVVPFKQRNAKIAARPSCKYQSKLQRELNNCTAAMMFVID